MYIQNLADKPAGKGMKADEGQKTLDAAFTTSKESALEQAVFTGGEVAKKEG